MEALGFPSLNTLTISYSNFQKRTPAKLPSQTNYFSSSCSKPRTPSYRSHRFRRSVTRMQADNENFELKQMRDMALLKRDGTLWYEIRRQKIDDCVFHMIRDGKVKSLTPREAGYAIQLSNKTLLDVRPSTEHKKAWMKGSTWIPIFDVSDEFNAGTLAQKVTSFAMGGWWSGVHTLSYNREFLPKVDEKFSKDTDLIIACQKGLRSIAACEVLYNTGYTNLFWVQGRLEAAEEKDLVREGPQPFKFAGIGGVSEFLGWTDQQRDQAAKEGWGYRLMFSARLVGVFLIADALFLGAQQAIQYLQDIRSH